MLEVVHVLSNLRAYLDPRAYADSLARGLVPPKTYKRLLSRTRKPGDPLVRIKVAHGLAILAAANHLVEMFGVVFTLGVDFGRRFGLELDVGDVKQIEIATRVNVTQQSLSKYRLERSAPRLMIALQIAQVFGPVRVTHAHDNYSRYVGDL